MRLPDFLVIGAYKSGTTSLHFYLGQHPEVFVPKKKEPNFFAVDENPDANPRLLRGSVTSLEDYAHLFEGADERMRVGEVSPEYLVNSWAPRRIRARVPEAQLIAVLRNPVDRAYSDYLMYVRDGVETAESFVAALEAQPDRQAANQLGGSYIRSGLYAQQFDPYFALFPREHIRVHTFDDLVADPVGVMNDLFRFLDVSSVAEQLRLETHNPSGVPRNRAAAVLFRSGKRLGRFVSPALRDRSRRLLARGLVREPLSADERAEALRYFHEDIRRLEDLLGRDLTRWLEPRTN